MYDIQHCVSNPEQALAVRRSNLSARSHLQTRLVIINHSNKKTVQKIYKNFCESTDQIYLSSMVQYLNKAL